MVQTKQVPHVSFSKNVNSMVDRAFEYLNIPKGMADEIKACNSIIKVSFPAQMDDET